VASQLCCLCCRLHTACHHQEKVACDSQCNSSLVTCCSHFTSKTCVKQPVGAAFALAGVLLPLVRLSTSVNMLQDGSQIQQYILHQTCLAPTGVEPLCLLLQGGFESGFEGSAGGGGQTKEHAQLARSLGVEQLAVVISKLDTCDFSQQRFQDIQSTLLPFLKGCGFRPGSIQWLPAVGPTGQNLVKPPTEPQLSWFKVNLFFPIHACGSPTQPLLQQRHCFVQHRLSPVLCNPCSKGKICILPGLAQFASIHLCFTAKSLCSCGSDQQSCFASGQQLACHTHSHHPACLHALTSRAGVNWIHDAGTFCCGSHQCLQALRASH
jgi:hypothetical protein